MTKKKKKMKTWKIVVLSLALAGAAVVAFIGGRYYVDNKRPNFTEDYILYVYPDTLLGEITDSLKANAGLISEKSLWRCFGKMELIADDEATKARLAVPDTVSDPHALLTAPLPERRLKPGKYVVTPQTTSIELARKLVFGWQTADNHLVLSSTLRKKDRIAQRISAQMMVDSATVMAALNDSAFLSKYGRTPEDVFGFLLKDSYEMYWTLSIREIFDRFQKEYDRFWNEERLAAAKAQGLTPRQVEIIASIVTGESLQKQEFPTIAGVYLNRFRKGMKLQADPTIAFCYDYTLDRILKKHLKFDSPYNTYMHVGLPPAPINVPEKAALEAVLHPENHRYIYFCASSDFDGTHDFAVTYSEHLRNARKFQRALTARRRAAAASN